MTRRSESRGRDNSSTRRLAARLKRDARVCSLCGLPIDPDLRSPHPMSFTMDHVVPVSMGGVVNDPGNVRAAHRICNMKRGTGRQSARSQGDRSADW